MAQYAVLDGEQFYSDFLNVHSLYPIAMKVCCGEYVRIAKYRHIVIVCAGTEMLMVFFSFMLSRPHFEQAVEMSFSRTANIY